MRRKVALFLLDLTCFVTRLVSNIAMTVFAKASMARLRHFTLKPRPGDIYISTFNKAGTTWMQMILYQLVTAGRGEFDHISQVAPFYDELPFVGPAERLLEELPSPRLLKTHLPYEELNPPKDARIVYVTRNLADNLVSHYHHACLAMALNVDFDGFVREALSEGGPNWYPHLRSWWPHRNDPNVLHVRYEELIQDLEGQIRRVAAFCNIPIQEDRMPDILERCGFAYMKKLDARFDFRLRFYDKDGPKGGFIRKGGVGGGKERLTAEHRAQVEKLVEKAQKELGYTDAPVAAAAQEPGAPAAEKAAGGAR